MNSVNAWTLTTVPYKPNANQLQTVDIWLPPASGSRAPWVIYIHGGAWRDPLVLSNSFATTVSHLDPAASNIAGIASINYSLSPHPHHPTQPSPPKDLEEETVDKSRVATHPDHIFDVLTALGFLQEKYEFGGNYVLVGHSCGATIALQVAMDHKRWVDECWNLKVAKPKAIIGLNGLYDMPKLIHEPGEKHQKLAPVYTAFTKLAFGLEEKVWHNISPSSVDDWAKEWKEGKEIILAQSLEDSLVPYSQTEDMLKQLKASKSGMLKVQEVPATGDHNFLWEDGKGVAEIIIEAVDKL
jgi:kynurenine formamidase